MLLAITCILATTLSHTIIFRFLFQLSLLNVYMFVNIQGAIKGNKLAVSCDIWTEYHEMGLGGIKAVADYKVYTAGSLLDLLNFVAPKMMQRGSAHFSYGIAEDLDDPQYKHYKYWSNPLETK